MNSLATASRLLRHLPSTNTTSASLRSITTLSETLSAQVPAKQAKLAALKKEHGSKVIGQVTIDQLIGGARGVKCMLWETSNLDADEGIRFRGLTIPECQQILTIFVGGIHVRND
eukprot:scaffold33918_cov67-Cyclotella_meneghiniana.AAC.12